MSNTTPPAQSLDLPELEGFRVLEELARSPKAAIYKARRLVEQDIVAVKVYRPSLCEKAFVEKLASNAEAAFTLEHPALVRTLGCVQTDSRLLLISEYVSGDSLARILKSRTPFSPARALLVTLQCARGLHSAAKKKLFHGRLHPGDIILGEDTARVLGVGLGERPEHATWSGRDPYAFEPLMYTPPDAMPSKPFPESESGRAAADIYSLGAILLHLLTGWAPFKGSDEVALNTERERLGKPVHWQKSELSLPAGLPALIERMLSNEAANRPSYDEVVAGLNSALAMAEKIEGPAATFAAPKNGSRVLQENQSVATAHKVAMLVPASAARVHRRGINVYTTVLAAATTAMCLLLFVLAAKIFWFDEIAESSAQKTGARLPDGPKLSPASPQKGTPGPASANPAPAVPAALAAGGLPESNADYLSATKQLELIQAMLKSGDIKASPALVRILKSIAKKAGDDTQTGLKALILSEEIDETVRGGVPRPASGAPAPVAQTTPKPAVSEIPGYIPGVGKLGPGRMPEDPANAAKPPLTPPAPAPAPAAIRPDDSAQAVLLSAGLRSIMAKAGRCQYAGAQNDIAQLAATTNAEAAKKTLAEYAELVRQEQAFFKRCQAHLLEQIEKRPRHDSPLQLYPRKNDPNGDDIVDLDESGLKVRVKTGSDSVIQTREWDRVPAAQAFTLMQLLADHESVDDQLGMAIFAFNRKLKEQLATTLSSAHALPGGAEKSASLEESLKRLTPVE